MENSFTTLNMAGIQVSDFFRLEARENGVWVEIGESFGIMSGILIRWGEWDATLKRLEFQRTRISETE